MAELSARLVEQFRTAADARRASSDKTRPAPPPRQSSPAVSSAPSTRGSEVAVTTPSPGPIPAPPVDTSSPIIAPPPVPPAAVVPRPAPIEPPAVASQPAPARGEPPIERRSPNPPAPAGEDDDAAIRKVVATYVHAIETKDLGLFRSVKPNMSADEQRRVEEGFRAVTSQRVDVTIVAIEHRGQEASVRLRRHDVIQAAGRQQTADSQQTMTLTKTGAGWVIREIGR